MTLQEKYFGLRRNLGAHASYDLLQRLESVSITLFAKNVPLGHPDPFALRDAKTAAHMLEGILDLLAKEQNPAHAPVKEFYDAVCAHYGVPNKQPVVPAEAPPALTEAAPVPSLPAVPAPKAARPSAQRGKGRASSASAGASSPQKQE